MSVVLSRIVASLGAIALIAAGHAPAAPDTTFQDIPAASYATFGLDAKTTTADCLIGAARALKSRGWTYGEPSVGDHGGSFYATRASYKGVAICNLNAGVMNFVAMGPSGTESLALTNDLRSTIDGSPAPAIPKLTAPKASPPLSYYFQAGFEVDDARQLEGAMKNTFGELGWLLVRTKDTDSAAFGALYAFKDSYKAVALCDKDARAITVVIMGPDGDAVAKLGAELHDRLMSDTK